MTTQLELTAAPASAAPDPNLAWLEALLLQRACWMTAAEVAAEAQAIARGGSPLNERSVRRLASASDWILSGPGSPGYKHLKHASADEINHFANAAESQGKQMIERAIRLRHQAHAVLG